MKIRNLYYIIISLGLATFQTLFAQSNHDNAIDCRLQATNQVTGCRLEDRLEESERSNITTNYELRTANCGNSAESSNCYLIGQQVEPTTNYELPTTNDDNELSCHLMMDPAIVKGAEEVLEIEGFRQTIKDHPAAEPLVIHREEESVFIRPPQANSNATKAAVHSENRVIIDRLRSLFPPVTPSYDRRENATKALEEVILYVEEATEAKTSNSQPISDLWEKIAEQYQFLFEHHRKAAEAQMRGNKEEITRFNKADWSIRFSIDQLEAAVVCIEKSIQAERSRNQSVSDLWLKTAEQYQVAAEYKRKSAEAEVLGNETETGHFCKAADSAKYSANRFKTAAEALKASLIETYQGDEAISDLWEKIVVENQTTAEYWRKAAEAQVAGNEQNIDRFKYAADSARYGADELSEAVVPLQNAIKAARQGNQPLSEIWHKSAEQHQISAMHYLKAAESEALGTYIPLNQYSRLDKAAYDASCSAEEFKTAAEGYPSKNKQEYARSKEAAKIFASGDKEKCERLEKTAGITYFLSEALRCLAELAEIKKSGDKKDIPLLHQSAQYNKAASNSMKSSLDRLEKASEASRIGNYPLSTLWKKAAEQYQSAAEYYSKSAEFYESDCNKDLRKDDVRRFCEKSGWQDGQLFGGDWRGLDLGFAWNGGCGRYALQSAFRLEKAIECIEKAISAEKKENQSLSDLWNKVAEQYQITADYSSKHVEALAASLNFSGDDETSTQLKCKTNTAWEIAQQLECSAIALEKVIEAESNNNQPLADLWRKKAEQYQVAVEYERKHEENLVFRFAKVCLSESKQEENERFYETRDIARSSAKCLNKAAIAFEKFCQAEKIGNQLLSTLWRKSFEQNQVAVERYQRGVEDFKSNRSFDIGQGISYTESYANQLRDAAISLEQAIKAEESNNQPLAILWAKSSEQWQAASEYMRQALEFYEKEGHNYCNNVLGSKAGVLQCAKTAQCLSKADYFDHLGKSSWSSALQFKKAAELLEQAIEAETKGTRLLSKLATANEVQGADGAQKLSVQKLLDISSTGATQQFAAEVEYQVVGRPRDRLRRAELEQPEGQAEWERASQFEKKSNHSISTLYRKASSLKQAAAEYEIKDQEDYLQESDPVGYNENTCFYYAAKSAKNSADQLEEAAALVEKAIQAEQADNQYLSTLCRKAVDFYQVAADYNKKASDAYAQKNKIEGDEFNQTAESAKDSADEAKREVDLIFFVNDLS